MVDVWRVSGSLISEFGRRVQVRDTAADSGHMPGETLRSVAGTNRVPRDWDQLQTTETRRDLLESRERSTCGLREAYATFDLRKELL